MEGEADSDGDGTITVDELYDYAFDEIVRVTPKQKPNKSAAKQESEIILRQITRLEDIRPVSLPDELIEATEDNRTFVREGAVQQLARLLKGKNLGLARSARAALERIEREDDSRRVSQAATMALEPIRQAERLALQKAEEERLAAEKAVEQQLAEQKAEEERKVRQEAARLAVQLEEERRLTQQKIDEERKAKEEAEREIARLEAERNAKEKVVREAALHPVPEEHTEPAAEIKNKFSRFGVYARQEWQALINRVRALPKNRLRVYLPIGLAVSVVVILLFVFYQQFKDPPLYFSMTVDGSTNIYSYHNGTASRVTSTAKTVKNWSPVTSPFGDLYFTSDRTGKAEIYRIKDDGQVEQVTNTPGTDSSWSPAVSASGDVYFTSNRTGKAEIYRINNDGQTEQVTNTPDAAASWFPVVSGSEDLYFTSDRTGKPEIYRLLKDGQVQQMTNTPGGTASWAPAVNVWGDLYFTSNRTGKAETYRINNDGKVEQITNTPGWSASWAPVIRGQNLYFTSNRDGNNSVYLLEGSKAVQVTST